MSAKTWRWIAVILTGIAVWFSLSGIVMRLADPYRDVSDRLILASVCFILCLLVWGYRVEGPEVNHLTLELYDSEDAAEPHTVMNLTRDQKREPD